MSAETEKNRIEALSRGISDLWSDGTFDDRQYSKAKMTLAAEAVDAGLVDLAYDIVSMVPPKYFEADAKTDMADAKYFAQCLRVFEALKKNKLNVDTTVIVPTMKMALA
jgi:hypothetical protein